MATDYTPVAIQLVDDDLGPTGVSRIPTEIYDWCVGQVAKRLGEIDKLSNGIVQYGADGETSFMSADPLKPARPVLTKYKGIGACG